MEFGVVILDVMLNRFQIRVFDIWMKDTIILNSYVFNDISAWTLFKYMW
jgi:hypothetical protein